MSAEISENNEISAETPGRLEPMIQLRNIPSVDELKTSAAGLELVEHYGEDATVQALRSVTGEIRVAITEGRSVPTDVDQIISRANNWLDELVSSSLKTVINATGVIVHTNLGRSPISDDAIQALRRSAEGYSNLEFDLTFGSRGSRNAHISRMLLDLTGAEAALVVNNNAAAVLLVLAALCKDREVVISRGQLIEIGGGFRIPDVLNQSGAQLIEVGTTNRTHLADYDGVINENSAAIFVAHHSNFKIVGFTKEPSLRELARLAHERGLILLFDQGSGALIDTQQYGLEHELTVREALESGADLVCFSGDKLLGGPQAGIICGRAELLEEVKSHPLARALRTDKLTLAALSATLVPYVTQKRDSEIPVWQMISRTVPQIQASAERISVQLIAAGVFAEVIDGESTVGGGSLPGTSLPTKLVAVQQQGVSELARLLRLNDPAVAARIANDRLLIDPRTLMEGQEETIVKAIIDKSRRLQEVAN